MGDIVELETKSMMLSRLPRKEGNEFKTAKIAFYTKNNPHKVPDLFPTKELEYDSIEKVRIIDLNVSYYLEGNDLVLNNLSNVRIRQEGTLLWVTGKQDKKEF